MSAEESTALPTPASSDCSSGFSHAGFAPALASRMKASCLSGYDCEATWARVPKDKVASMTEEAEPMRKVLGHPTRTSGSTKPQPSSKPTEEPDKRSGASSMRSRSAAKGNSQRLRSSGSQPRTPGKSLSPVRPPRSVSPSGERSPAASHAARARGSSVSLSVSALTSHNALLERELQESHHARAELEQKLDEERNRSSADRAQLARLAARIEQLESSREVPRSEVNAALLDDNRFLRAELEAEKLTVQELTQKLESLRGEVPSPTVIFSSSQEKLLEENEKLRSDLKQSQVMLAKYTEELSMIMPDVELILTQWKADNKGTNGSCPAQSSNDRGLISGASSSATAPTGVGERQRPTSPGVPRAQTRTISPVSRGSSGPGANTRPRSSGRSGIASSASNRGPTSPQPSQQPCMRNKARASNDRGTKVR